MLCCLEWEWGQQVHWPQGGCGGSPPVYTPSLSCTSTDGSGLEGQDAGRGATR